MSSTFLPRKFDKETGCAIADRRQSEVGVPLADLRCIRRGRCTRGRTEQHPTGREGEDQLLHCPSPWFHSGALIVK